MIVRRGERKPMALTVEVVVGLPQILNKLRSETQDAVVMALRAAAEGEDVTITAYGALTEPTGVYPTRQPLTQGSARRSTRAHPPLTMVDRSDSGCRLHGPTLGSNPIMPGALIALREEAASPWTLAIVRRVKKRLAGKRVEIGVEYLGRDPRRVIVVGPEGDAASGPFRQRSSAVCRALSFGEREVSRAADEDAGPAGARARAQRSPFGALAHRRLHDPAQGTARRAGRVHLVAVRRSSSTGRPTSRQRPRPSSSLIGYMFG